MTIDNPWIERENKLLSPLAQKSTDSKGRAFPEPQSFRSPYQRDRDRIIHSRAFRRLEYKTQVFVNYQGDHYRTRLTHTIEVAGISRTIARILGLNEDLTEAIALAHDVGHPPFGHSGEEILNKLMKAHGGFEHNLQSLRTVEKLERKYPQFEGLNLTYEVRKGLIKHNYSLAKLKSLAIDNADDGLHNISLEASIVNIADEITYNTHDLDDVLTSNLLKNADLQKITIWKEINQNIQKEFPKASENRQNAYTIRTIINTLVTDLLDNSMSLIKHNNIKTQQDVFNTKIPLITLSTAMQKKNAELKKFLYLYFYAHPKVLRTKEKAKKIIEFLFHLYIKQPELFLKQPKKITNLHRIVCDYIAGMTDRFAYREYYRLKKKYPAQK